MNGVCLKGHAKCRENVSILGSYILCLVKKMYIYTVNKELSFNCFSILSNSNLELDPKGPKRNTMEGLHKLFLHTKFSFNMSTVTKDIQFQPCFLFLVTATLTLNLGTQTKSKEMSHKLFLHTKFSYSMFSVTKDIQFQPSFLFLVTANLTLGVPNAIPWKVSIKSFDIPSLVTVCRT